MAEGVFTIEWRTVAAVPTILGTGLTGVNLANDVVLTNTVAPYLNNPMYADMTIGATGSGGQARLTLCFGPEQVGKRAVVYVKFSNTITEFEVQVWGTGCWPINNPGSGPSTPNALWVGTLVGITDPLPPDETEAPSPPPTHDPFIPWLLLTIDQSTADCTLADIITVKINPIDTVTISAASVYKDGISTGYNLAQLIAGVTFDQPGDYEVRITFQYVGDPTNPVPAPITETFTRDFTISETPFPVMQRQSRVYSWVEPGEAMRFDDVLADNGTVEYDALTGAFTLRFCGDYFIKWFIVPEAGVTTDGAGFAIAFGGGADLIGTSHAKISPSVGFTILKVNGPPPTIQLINVADGNIELSKMTQVTAGIVMFKVGDETSGL